ncbi:MAG: hypothetical protein O2955_09420 [Planctomycetota bacterium]|nr:hypothetical protein [Planctomycetota bacterium]MDA1212728.1 hypothetical protein [Planctomycetota bacterium]
MSNFGRVMVFATMVFSLVFMGAALAVYYGGPNWESQFANLPEYLFEKSATIPGQKSTWSVKLGRSGEQVNSGVVLPKVIMAAQADKLQKQQDAISVVQPRIDQIQQQTEYTKALIEADLKGLAVKEEQLIEELKVLDEEIEELKQQAIAQTQLAFTIQEETERRREDVFRMSQFLSALRTDLSFAEQLQSELRTQIAPIEINNKYLTSRKKQLEKQTGTNYEPAEE